MSKPIRATAPASLMLLGEHAVLHHHLAIVCAINRFITASLTPRTDHRIIIRSHLGLLESSLETISLSKPFEFVTASILSMRAQISTGFDLQIESDFSHEVGLGSSAAVTVASLTVLQEWINPRPIDEGLRNALLTQALKIIQCVQGAGSGADAAASIWGGTLAYRRQAPSVEKLKHNPPLTAVYSGHKKPTADVIQQIEEERQREPAKIQALFSEINHCSEAAKIAIQAADWATLGNIMNRHQIAMKDLDLSNALLDQLISQLREYPEISGAKISGSGLGDCIVGLGTLNSLCFPQNSSQSALGIKQLNIRISEEGVYASL